MSENQLISAAFPNNISLYIKKKVLHPIISGNKFRKLKYNLEEAKKQNQKVLLTFGGAFSNHIVAVAGQERSLGLKPSESLEEKELQDKNFRKPKFVTSSTIRNEICFCNQRAISIKRIGKLYTTNTKRFWQFLFTSRRRPNQLAIKGCEEILTETDAEFTHVCASVGTRWYNYRNN